MYIFFNLNKQCVLTFLIIMMYSIKFLKKLIFEYLYLFIFHRIFTEERKYTMPQTSRI